MLLNPGVLTKYDRTWVLLEELGYSVAIAWWDQYRKEDGDIDENSNWENFKEIPASEFWKICQAIARQEYRSLTKSLGTQPNQREKPIPRMDAIPLVQEVVKLREFSRILDYRQSVRRQMHQLGLDWGSPILIGWLETNQVDSANLSLNHLKRLKQFLTLQFV
jgi:hypothetical protein